MMVAKWIMLAGVGFFAIGVIALVLGDSVTAIVFAIWSGWCAVVSVVLHRWGYPMPKEKVSR